MRDHDEVFRRVMKAKEQYEQQEKEKKMFKLSKSVPGGGARYKKEGRKSSKLFVWGMRAAAALLWVVLIGGTAAAVYYGVKNKNGKGPLSGGNPTEQVSNTPAGNAADTTLTLWCTAAEGSYDKVAFDRAIAEMRVKYPNIELRKEACNEPELIMKVKNALQQGTAPDIFWVGDDYSLDNMAALGQVYCLDGAYADFADALSGVMCGPVTYNGHLYGVPYTLNTGVLYVNREVLLAAGIDAVPSTYDELIACCDTLCQNGVVPFGCATGHYSEWCMSEFLEQLIIKNAGTSALEAIYRNDASWQNPAIAEAIDEYEEYVRKGYLPSADANLENEDVKAGFMSGNYAFFVGGSWYCKDFAESGCDIVAVEFPVMDSTNAGAGQFLCGSNGILAVNNSSANKELAAQYAMELAQLVSKYIYLDGMGLPAWKVNYEVSGVNALSVQVVGMLRQADGLVLFSDHVMDTDTQITYMNLIRRAYNREINGAAFTAAMDAFRAEQNESEE
ncbi:MAG: extracellular solute-binding protein [Lachnospiraceae bacterium]|nr:extracellular solute-binding protein [Lachnospiraceae bacterium]